MSTPFYNRVQKLRKQYPQSRSAVLPALRLAQEGHGGWAPSEALREVADALDETPAYVVSIASFYDMLNLEPVGRHLVEVCTNLSCALAGEAVQHRLRARKSAGELRADLDQV